LEVPLIVLHTYGSEVKLLKLLSDARFLLAGISSGFVYFLYTFLEPILA
jgi:hypothetical protein